MKKNLYLVFICIACFITSAINAQSKTNAVTYANTSLSNLTSPTSINQSLLVDKDNSHNIGSTTKGWKNIYLDSAVYIGGLKLLTSKTGTGLYNTAAGAGALAKNTSGYSNTAIGFNALNKNTTGYQNLAAGIKALTENTTGANNTANGYYALQNNASGNYNIAIGYESLGENNSGNDNIGIGQGTNLDNETGHSNIAIGSLALVYNQNLNNIIAIGDSALMNLESGSGHCTAVGSKAGINSFGSNNTFLGYHAGNSVYQGSGNTIIGYGADVSDDYNNATAVGNFAVATASNSVRIGNSSVTSIGGQVGWTNFSDERIKTNIKQNVPGLTFINLLKPVTYNFNIDKQQAITGKKDDAEWSGKYDIQKILFTGFLAQDVAAAAKKINYEFSGVDKPANDKDVYGLRYSDFVVPLVKGEQELSKQNDSLKSIVTSLQNQVDELRAMIVSSQSTINSQQSTSITSVLSQNIPNPFSNSTTISYSIPQKFSSAKIIITDKNGNTLKQINLSNNKGNVSVDAATLTSGAYQYTLFVDGRTIATKQMEILK